MPYDLKEIAAISGMPGLYRLVSPTRTGVIIEALDGRGTRSIASARNKVSLLQEISIYTQDYDQTVPLTEVFDRIHQQFGAELELTSKSDDRDLATFMGKIIPDYDRDRVYMSDMKKLVTWYGIVSKNLEYQAPATDEDDATPATDEPLSTGGEISADATATDDAATANPEATAPAPKKGKKKAE
ncbi:DUF5606 domain-containing protein [Hymenobacter aerilatus]|uniref:DUF5606 domain-containing protein n=1 Tax=Hymenobacter aerilatus TaxID=2932251 RepID=A0A8T9T5Z6_9BACT|nr:DUF5606 domain-containing protein [Hymenobacter aerilatus]UOR07269.1 DUF5606 domain-containing protein [Hymenobacter aerilatus]